MQRSVASQRANGQGNGGRVGNGGQLKDLERGPSSDPCSTCHIHRALRIVEGVARTSEEAEKHSGPVDLC